jgi:signal transduction histidine kinase
MSADSALAERILVLAPTGSDAPNALRVLHQHGLHAVACLDVPELCAAAVGGVGALLVAEEALTPANAPLLLVLLQEQPSWSDVPLLLITSGGDATQASLRTFTALSASGNITLLERPFRLITLVSAAQVALRARRRQYEVRRLLEQHARDQAELREHAQTLEQRVAERTARLAETISELEAFSYSVSHDLRAPLRTMQGYSHYLLEDAGHLLPEQSRRHLDRIAACATRLDALVQDILTYSRVTRSDLEISPVDLDRLIREIVEQYPGFQPPMATVTMRGPIPPVRGHEGSLTQCVSNLLGNAVKFVAPGVTPSIEIWSELRGPEVRVLFGDNGIGIDPAAQPKMVRVLFGDNGIGIDPAAQPKIFKMFERVHQQGDYEGTGIGLAIVRKAVERMGGTVGVDSEPGRGSQFWIQLPAGAP